MQPWLRLLGIVGAAIAASALVWHLDWPFKPAPIILVVLAASLVVEPWRYKRILAAPPRGEGWERTGERFIDPASGRAIDVHCNARTGQRAYVALDR